MEKINEITLEDIIIYIKYNLIKIIITSIILSSIPGYYTAKAFFDNSASVTYKYETSPLSSNDFRKLNKYINELYENTLLDQLRQKLEFYHTEYLTGNKEIFKFNKESNENHIFIDSYFFSDALKNSNFIDKNNFGYEIKKDPKRTFTFTIVFTKFINDLNILDTDKIVTELSMNINNQIVKSIDDLINHGNLKYKLQKKEILKNIVRSNELIGKSFYFNLKNEIKALEEKLKIIELVDSETSSDIQYSLTSSEYDVDLYASIILGREALEKQIEIKSNKLNQSYDDLPQIYYNNQLFDLIKNDVFSNPLDINESRFINRSLDFFKVYDIELIKSSLSLELTLTYILLIFFISFTISVILYIFIESLRLKK
jgi:hypothetical protein